MKGYISDMDSGSIILHYLDIDSKLKIDTSAISKGQFYFKGSIKEPTYATLNFPDYRQVFGDMNVANLFLEPKVITASFSSHKLNSGVYTGSATQDLYSGFLAGENKIALKWKAVMDEHSKLLAEYSNENIGTQREKEIDQRLEELSPKIQQYNKEIEDLQYQYIVENPGNYVSAFLLCQFQQRPELDFVKKIYDGFSEKIKNYHYGRYIGDEIKRRELVAIGATAPDFVATTARQKSFSLRDTKGDFVLLDFWASWCVPCRKEIPELKSTYARYHSKGLEIVTISIDRNETDWKKALQEEGIAEFNNVRSNPEISKLYENVFRPIPSKILINRKGVIIWKQEYEGTTENKSLEDVLKENFNP